MKFRIAISFGAAAALATVLASPATALDLPEQSGFDSPTRGATLTGGSVVEARWSRAPSVDDVDEAELVLSLDGGQTFSVRISAELSPDAVSYRWRVPAVPTSTARLALRVGSGHEKGLERFVAVSEPFAIVAEGAEPEALIRGGSEWWTRQALSEGTVGDLLETSVKTEGDRLVAPRSETDADRPVPTLELTPPSAVAEILSPSRIFGCVSFRRASLSPAVPVPLRL